MVAKEKLDWIKANLKYGDQKLISQWPASTSTPWFLFCVAACTARMARWSSTRPKKSSQPGSLSKKKKAAVSKRNCSSNSFFHMASNR
jgi:hypothetical protein